jgi:hypothetical protein
MVTHVLHCSQCLDSGTHASQVPHFFSLLFRSSFLFSSFSFLLSFSFSSSFFVIFLVFFVLLLLFSFSLSVLPFRSSFYFLSYPTPLPPVPFPLFRD